MSSPSKPIPLSTTPGLNAWNKSVKIEALMLRFRALAVTATYRSAAPDPTPDEFAMWAKDLRRGRASIIGSLIRFIKIVEQRKMGAQGRRIVLDAIALTQEYVDLTLPETQGITKALNTCEVDIQPAKARAVAYSRHSKLSHRSA